MRARPSCKQERVFWKVADIGVKQGLVTCRQVATIARLEESRKSPFWKRHLQDLKKFMAWQSQNRDTGEEKVTSEDAMGAERPARDSHSDEGKGKQ
jgi:hypothetical protein